jgi:hypothetical protein
MLRCSCITQQSQLFVPGPGTEIGTPHSPLALSPCSWHNPMEKLMTKFTLLGAAAILSSLLAGPAMAQHALAQPDYYVQSGACPGHEAGNPYTREGDYMAWSGWRARGGWDDRNDWNCLRPSHLRHHAAAF